MKLTPDSASEHSTKKDVIDKSYKYVTTFRDLGACFGRDVQSPVVLSLMACHMFVC